MVEEEDAEGAAAEAELGSGWPMVGSASRDVSFDFTSSPLFAISNGNLPGDDSFLLFNLRDWSTSLGNDWRSASG